MIRAWHRHDTMRLYDNDAITAYPSPAPCVLPSIPRSLRHFPHPAFCLHK